MANENKTAKEYVQKGYLIAHLANCGIRTINYDEWERLCECIHEAKPADVIEVVHGGWIKMDKRGNNVQCSKCGNTLDLRGVNAGRGDANYCPNCGAKMSTQSNAFLTH